ncbi:HAD family hydrolase [Fodinicurvata fenggangensis]|uniref:HAD family hydrolase n=1 Tax=Fodinicurvata fenggangensis TaxID=1121830 RepID=UPI00138E38F1|nr:HAD family hydrolase [Fodinicurvata fenggangensis]
MPPRALLFDWDNTLVNTWPTIHAALHVTFENFGLQPWSLEEVRHNVRVSAREAFPDLFGERSDEALDVFYEAFKAQHLEQLAAIEGATELLADLHGRGLYLGVVSNKSGSFLRREVAHLGWDPFFSKVIGATDAERDKPAVDPVMMALEGSGISPSRDVWFIGDTDVDLLCAENAGCTGVLLRPEPPAEGEFPRTWTHFHASDYRCLLALLR